MMITREEWDALEIGDTLHLKGYMFKLSTFKVAKVDSYTAPAKWTDSGILVDNDSPTVIEIKNSKEESLRFGYYNVVNSNSSIEKGDDRTIQSDNKSQYRLQ